jgi:hypothetical protein
LRAELFCTEKERRKKGKLQISLSKGRKKEEEPPQLKLFCVP